MITIPHRFKPRDYQIPLLSAMDGGIKRAVWIAHRRAGKDKTLLNYTIKKMFERVGTYFYLLPTYAQAKKIIWDGIDGSGTKFLDHFPPDIIKNKNNTDMKIELVNGSVFQLIGTDKIDSIMGTNPVGCVFSEYSLQNPKAWDLIRPILRENGGWAVFNYTPRGKNHGYDLYMMAKDNPEWFCQILTINDTRREDGKPIISAADIEAERAEGMDEDLIQQEYYASFTAAVTGAYYAKQLQAAEDEGRITSVPYDSHLPVETWWDLGKSDSTAIWFTQTYRKEIRVIDCLEDNGEGLPYYAKRLKEKPYVYAKHNLPHDIEVSDLSVDGRKKRKDILIELGINPIRTIAAGSVEVGIEAARSIIGRCWFDKIKCKDGLHALREYHKEYDEKKKVFKSYPCHDWSSHCFVGETKVLTRHGMRRIMDLPKTGEVYTLCGWKQYHSPRITRRNAPLVEVAFKGGYSVRCTPDHLFLTERGWKSAKDLIPFLQIQSTLTPLRNILKEACTGYGLMKNIYPEAVINYIGMFGLQLSEKFQKGVTYIIGMGVPSIITSKISNVLMVGNTYRMHGKKQDVTLQAPTILMKWQEKGPLNGIDQKKGDCGINDRPRGRRVGQSGNVLKKIVSFVGKSTKALIVKVGIIKNTVTLTAKPLIIESVKPLMDNDDVWCLTVPDVEHFSLSNGAVVHNCSDAFRYFAIGFKEDEKKSEYRPQIYTTEGAWMS